jgi:hypothetical protein
MMGEVSESNQQAELLLEVESPPEPGAPAPKKERDRRLSIVYSGPRTNLGMNRKRPESTVDRLIALAADEKPVEQGNGNAEGTTNLGALSMFGDPKLGLDQDPTGTALLQFRVLMPYMSQLLEMSRAEGGPGMSAELKQSLGELANSQRDLRIAVEDQVLQMKHLEEQMVRAKEVSDRTASESLEIVDDVRSVQSAVKKAGFALGGLLMVLIMLVAWLLERGYRFH